MLIELTLNQRSGISNEVREYGFGHLIAYFIKRKHLAVIPFFIETFIRSFSGMLLYVFNPLKYNLYKGRIKGMFFGFLKGLKS